MSKFLCAPLLLVALVLPVGAASYKTNIDEKANFSQYKTFSWYPIRVLGRHGVIESDDHWIPMLRGIVREQLLAKGLTEVQEGDDMMVAVYGLRDASAQLEAILYPGGVNWGIGWPTATLSRYNYSGTLAIALTDPKAKKAVFLGIANDSLKSDLSDAEKKAKKAAVKLFEKYPKLN